MKRQQLNVIINNACTLKCPYCFAKDLTESEYKNITLQDFNSILTFMINNEMKDIKILGGEPTIHPKFLEIVEMSLIKLAGKVTIFSNCAFSNKTLVDILRLTEKYPNRINILPNVNCKEDIGINMWINVCNNIRMLCDANVIGSLGINIYKINQNYNDYLQLALNNNISRLRVAFATNIRAKDEEEYYDVNALSTFNNFLQDCFKLKLYPTIDCNMVPMCKMNQELKASLMESLMANDSINITPKINVECHPVIDVDYNLIVHRCFGISGEKDNSLKLQEQDNVQQYWEYFNNLDQQIRLTPLFKESCSQCAMKKTNGQIPCGCLTYRKGVLYE